MSSSEPPSLTCHWELVVIVESSAVCWSVALALRRCFVWVLRKTKRML
jgi:hypothetical protein